MRQAVNDQADFIAERTDDNPGALAGNGKSAQENNPFRSTRAAGGAPPSPVRDRTPDESRIWQVMHSPSCARSGILCNPSSGDAFQLGHRCIGAQQDAWRMCCGKKGGCANKQAPERVRRMPQRPMLSQGAKQVVAVQTGAMNHKPDLSNYECSLLL